MTSKSSIFNFSFEESPGAAFSGAPMDPPNYINYYYNNNSYRKSIEFLVIFENVLVIGHVFDVMSF